MITGYTIPEDQLQYRIYLNSCKYPELRHCKDFSTLVEYFTDEELKCFEKEIKAYDRGGKITTIVCWVEGLITTSDLIAMYKEV